jgi:type VI secretion system protein ImpC
MAIETAAAHASQEAQVARREADEFAQMLKMSFEPPTERAATEIANAVRTLVEQALAAPSLVKTGILQTIEEMTAQLDKKLSVQMNQIMHAPEFQQIESAWRGLQYLVFQSDTDAMLKIRVMNISKDELHNDLQRFGDAAWDQSPLFKTIFEEEFGRIGGEPYGCLVGDYYFNHMPPDVSLLRDLSKIAAAAHAPFLAAADSSLLGMDAWNQLRNPRNLGALFEAPEYTAWRSLRDSDDARYIGLCMPRALARLPYGAKSWPVDEFAFDEDIEGLKGEKYSWMNPAYAMAANINRAFTEFGWCARIRGAQSGGEVEGLPTHAFQTNSGRADIRCPTEIAISDRRVTELCDLGFIPLIHRIDTERAFFLSAGSLFKPKAYQNNPEATAASTWASRLPLMFAGCRFAHHVKAMVRDNLGSRYEKEQLQRWLSNWIGEYVHDDPENSSEDERCRQPLANARITIEEVQGHGGYYLATFELRPHFQFEGLDADLTLVSRLPRVIAMA